jgi:hypothetical protein
MYNPAITRHMAMSIHDLTDDKSQNTASFTARRIQKPAIAIPNIRPSFVEIISFENTSDRMKNIARMYAVWIFNTCMTALLSEESGARLCCQSKSFQKERWNIAKSRLITPPICTNRFVFIVFSFSINLYYTCSCLTVHRIKVGIRKSRTITNTIGRMTVVGFGRKKSGTLIGRINSEMNLVVHKTA